MAGPSKSRVLDAALIVQTVKRLEARISERFPGSGLASVCRDLVETAQETASHVEALSRPYLGLRAMIVVVALLGIAAEIYAASLVHWGSVLQRADAVGLSQGLDSAVNLLLLSFAAIWFVLTLETRLKRRA